MDTSRDELIDSAGVRAMFGGRSKMWLWRRIEDNTIPRPIRITGRNYWRRSDITAAIDQVFKAQQVAA